MKRHSSICRLALPIIWGVLPWLSLPSPAIEVGWHDHMYLQLGDGVKLNHQQEPTSTGLVLTTNPATTNNTGSWTKTVTFAQHTYDMVKTLSVNSSVGLNAFIFSGDVNVSFFGKQTFDANDLVFVYTGIKEFGTTVYQPVWFSTNYTGVIAGFQKNLQGAALHDAITSTLGTHYVSGYDSEAMVSVIYTFHYASASVKQQLIASADGVSDVGSFSTFVSQFFGSTNTTATMSYQFYSTDPYQLTTNLISGSGGIIRSYQQFITFLNQIDAYGNAMVPERAKVTQYILDPLETMQGYKNMLAPYVPPPENLSDYNTFLQDDAALQARRQSLDKRIFGTTMTWLNAQGRHMMQQERNQVGRYLATMRAIAENHFTYGAALNVPSDITSYLRAANEVSVPQIYLLDYFPSGSDECIIGRVFCGCTNWTTSSPFYNVTALYHQTNYFTTSQQSSVPIHYDPSDFVTSVLKTYPSGAINTHLKALFASEQWPCLTNSNPDLSGYFVITQPTSQVASWTLEIDSVDASGRAVPADQMPFFSTRQIQSAGCQIPCTTPTPLIH